MTCNGCRRELKVGDRYINDTPGAFIGKDLEPGFDALLADLLGGGDDGQLVYCEDCTQTADDGWQVHMVYGDE